MQATTSNPTTGIVSNLGFQFYDTWTKTILDDVVFRGFSNADGNPHSKVSLAESFFFGFERHW